jgi:streptogramin lyase
MNRYGDLLTKRLTHTFFGRSGTRVIPTLIFSLTLLLAPILGNLPASADPTVTTYPIPTSNSNPYQITKGPDGALWFTESQSNKIGRITNAGAISEYNVPGGYFNPRDIVTGPDGALWFTSVGSRFIYRMTTDGAVTTYAANSFPRSIAAGPDGALWFTTESFAGNIWSIGRITTSGNVTIYPAANNTTGFINIATGSDGALWFTEQGNGAGENAIGRMTTSGAYSRYVTPHTNSFPFGITAGSDGALWFTETNTASIGRIDMTGAITEYPTPSGGDPSFGITAGSDGAIWYTSGSAYSVGRMTSSGSVTEYPVPSDNGGGLTGITGGFDGALWYAHSAAGASSIGRITTPNPVALQSINAGGGASGSFATDSSYSSGSAYSSTASVDTSNVSSPAPQSVYQSVRYGKTMTYTLSGLTPNTNYTLRLHFNELYWGAVTSGGVGSRVFNVAINGQSALSNYDIYQQAGGANKAIVEQLPATADATGNVAVQFTTVTDNAMVNGIELFDGTLPPQPPRPPYVASTVINAGGSTTGNFAADTEYSGGSTYSSPTAVDISNVSNPAPQSVYQTVRYGNFTYTIPQLTPNTNYRVRLHFNELYWGVGSTGGGAGSRVFNVVINGSPVLGNYDIYAAAGGANKAVIQEFVIPADAQGKIVIQFMSLVDNAMVNGIEVNPIAQ